MGEESGVGRLAGDGGGQDDGGLGDPVRRPWLMLPLSPDVAGDLALDIQDQAVAVRVGVRQVLSNAWLVTSSLIPTDAR